MVSAEKQDTEYIRTKSREVTRSYAELRLCAGRPLLSGLLVHKVTPKLRKVTSSYAQYCPNMAI